MKKLTVRKTGKTKYPDKTSINLLMKENDYSDPKFQIVLFVIFLLILGVFVKFMVVDKITEAYNAQQEYQRTELLISQLQESNQDYEKIREEYSHYGNGYLNDEEKAEQDRTKMMSVIDRNVLSKADIQSLEISGNVATLIIDNVRLSTVSQVVAALEQSDIVSYVTVSTAGTNTESTASVSATVIINFKEVGGEK